MTQEVDLPVRLGYIGKRMDDGTSEKFTGLPISGRDHTANLPERDHPQAVPQGSEVIRKESSLTRNMRRAAGALGLLGLFGAAAVSPQSSNLESSPPAPVPVSTPDTRTILAMPVVEPSPSLSNGQAGAIAQTAGPEIRTQNPEVVNGGIKAVAQIQQENAATDQNLDSRLKWQIAHGGPSPARPNAGNPQVDSDSK